MRHDIKRERKIVIIFSEGSFKIKNKTKCKNYTAADFLQEESWEEKKIVQKIIIIILCCVVRKENLTNRSERLWFFLHWLVVDRQTRHEFERNFIIEYKWSISGILIIKYKQHSLCNFMSNKFQFICALKGKWNDLFYS